MTARRAAAIGLLFAVFAAAPRDHRTPTLDALVRALEGVRDYTVTIDAHEVDAGRTDDRVLRFRMRKPDHAKMEVLSGRGAGTRLIWSGGTMVRVRGGVFSWVPLWVGLHDTRVTSLRGNTMLAADFAAALQCFAAHRDRVSEAPDGGDRGLVAVVLNRSSFGCPQDSAKDRAVTKDVLLVRRAEGSVVRRERFAGDVLVERWTLSAQRFNAGLRDDDFR